MKFTINTVARLTDRLFVSGGKQNSWIDTETGEIVTYKTPKRKLVPIARTKTCTIIVQGDKTYSEDVMYYPGSSLRGGLRRMAADIVCEAFLAKGITLDLDLYYVIRCGTSTKGAGRAADVLQSKAASEHPFASVFGGGPAFVWSRLSIGSLWPITPATLATKMVPDAYMGLSSGDLSLVEVSTFSRVDDLLRGNGQAPDVVTNFNEVLADWLKRLEESRANRDAEQEEGAGDKANGKKVAIALYSAREVLAPGAILHGRHTLDTSLAGPAALGIFILSLARLIERERFGGVAREGYGRLNMDATLSQPDKGSVPLLSSVDGVVTINRENAVIAEAIAAWEKFAAEITVESFEKAFMLGKDEAEAGDKSKKKDAK